MPRLRDGKGGETALPDQICHNEIQAAPSETALARDHTSIDALRAHPRLARFIAWVQGRPPEFLSRTPGAAPPPAGLFRTNGADIRVMRGPR